MPSRRAGDPQALLVPALSGAALLCPAVAHAHGGYGVVVAGIFVGLPGLLLLCGLIAASLLLGSRPDVRPERRGYATAIIVVSLVPPVLFPAVSLWLDDSSQAPGVTAFLSLPLWALSAASVLLALRVRRKN